MSKDQYATDPGIGETISHAEWLKQHIDYIEKKYPKKGKDRSIAIIKMNMEEQMIWGDGTMKFYWDKK